MYTLVVVVHTDEFYPQFAIYVAVACIAVDLILVRETIDFRFSRLPVMTPM